MPARYSKLQLYNRHQLARQLNADLTDSQNQTIQTNTDSKIEFKTPSLFNPVPSGRSDQESPGISYQYKFATRTKHDDRERISRIYQSKTFRQKNLNSERHVATHISENHSKLLNRDNSGSKQQN